MPGISKAINFGPRRASLTTVTATLYDNAGNLSAGPYSGASILSFGGGCFGCRLIAPAGFTDGFVKWSSGEATPLLLLDDVNLQPVTVTFSGNGAVACTVLLKDGNGVPLANQLVWFWDSTLTTVKAGPCVTDGTGTAYANLDPANYQVVVASSQFYQSLPAQPITVDATHKAFSYVLTAIAPVSTTDPTAVVITGTLLSLNVTRPQNQTIKIYPRATGVLKTAGGQLVTGDVPFVTTSDANGQFAIKLPRSSQLSPLSPNDNNQYVIEIPSARLKRYFTAPDLGTADILTCLVPGP